MSTPPTPACAPWERGDDCSFNLRTARIALACIMSVVLLYCFYLTIKVGKRNKYTASRPVTCLLLVGASLLCDIVEQIAVVSNMVPTDWSTWYEAAYGSNTLDALGDIFLALALWYFSCIWSDNVALLRHKGGNKEGRYRGLKVIRLIYGFIFFGTVPLAITFAISSYVDGLYDKVAIAYMAWGAFTGFVLLSPLSLYMKYIVHDLPTQVRSERSYKQLKFQTDLNWIEQFTWNILLIIALVTFVAYLSGGNSNGSLIGTAAVLIQICWLLIHAQVLGFFAFVPHAQSQSPTFDEHLLRTLLEGETISDADSDKSLQLQELDVSKPRSTSVTQGIDAIEAEPIGQELGQV